MTTITIYKSKSGRFKRFTCSGHSGYAEFGNDIVCASISILVINCINSLEELANEEMSITENEEDGYIDCIFTNDINDKSKLLLESMILGLNSIAEQCGKKYLRLKIKEV
ncbi:MAG: ribosomal-processing cysteine protease Prp [Lachnospiraceae bacterium]|nr:ribosomal-processing cysteine protease Prp [Lachnospiraceae bacterium]